MYDTKGIDFKTGLIVGRFEGFQNAHYRMMCLALNTCEKVVILVGSAQESYTKRNPFPVKLRIKMIESCFESEVMMGRLIIRPLHDLTDENDNDNKGWGTYLFKNFKKACGKDYPSLTFYGNDDNRSNWIFPDTIENVSELIISRKYDDISATQVRQYILDGDYDCFASTTPKKTHKFYDEMRNILIAVHDSETCSKVIDLISKDGLTSLLENDKILYDKIIDIIREHENEKTEE